MKRISSVLLTIFSVGVLIGLFSGAVAFAGYVVALLIGGEAATALCAFIYNDFFPVVIRICSISVGFGLIGMYINKMKALSFGNGDKK